MFNVQMEVGYVTEPPRTFAYYTYQSNYMLHAIHFNWKGRYSIQMVFADI